VIRVHWQDETLWVRRLVFRPSDWRSAGVPVEQLAARAGLLIADESATPRAGDFWLGCSPLGGWGDADPAAVGWACFVDAPLAFALLWVAADLGPRRTPAARVA
jgi:hypothetical protein